MNIMKPHYTLQQCIDKLGEEAGTRYWNITLECSVHPEMALVWADDCEKEALAEPNEAMAKVLAGWSMALRQNYHMWLNTESRKFKAKYD